MKKRNKTLILVAKVSLEFLVTLAEQLSQLAEECVICMKELFVRRQELFHVGDARLVHTGQLDGESPVEGDGGDAVNCADARVAPPDMTNNIFYLSMVILKCYGPSGLSCLCTSRLSLDRVAPRGRHFLWRTFCTAVRMSRSRARLGPGTYG